MKSPAARVRAAVEHHAEVRGLTLERLCIQAGRDKSYLSSALKDYAHCVVLHFRELVKFDPDLIDWAIATAAKKSTRHRVPSCAVYPIAWRRWV